MERQIETLRYVQENMRSLAIMLDQMTTRPALRTGENLRECARLVHLTAKSAEQTERFLTA